MIMFRWILTMLSMSIYFSCCLCIGSDTISEGQSLFANQTIVSKRGKFKLGFFSPENSSDSYVGIWYGNIPVQTVVWVANRYDPVPEGYYSSLRLALTNGSLNIYGDRLEITWAPAISKASEAVLLDSGNFVVSNDSGIIWQSFDNPTDTWLPGGNIGLMSRMSETEARLVSWRNPSNPAPGVFSLEINPNGGAEIFLMRNSSQIYWRSGVLQGGNFASLSGFSLPGDSNFTYVSRDDSVYIIYNVFNESIISRITLNYGGAILLWIWSAGQWISYLAFNFDQCQFYGMCGANAVCDIENAPLCRCLIGFVPKIQQDWERFDFSGGCVRRVPLQCVKGNAEFTKVSNISLPANQEPLAVGMSDICEFACSVNCSCTAYAYSSKGGCLLYSMDLLDLRGLTFSSNSSDLYIRMSSVRLAGKGNKNVLPLALALPIAAAMLICCSVSCYSRRKLKRKEFQRAHQNLLLLELSFNGPPNRAGGTSHGEERKNEYELPVFSFSSVAAATNNFSISNKLGEGGFGPVYKGELLNGLFVAVKRLSRRSGQGLEEFRNETELIAKLQHRNLVGILGCCVEQDEKILVYEYMPNKSLDFFLFDPTKAELLDWGKRVHIIEGIAQGLLYLHQYSRLRIVHRDLKASNILLDDEINPKISDFGMARIFGGNRSQANTNRIVGTYGYMSPEYAMAGLFSVKSDVFAFGVLMLEIVSGKRNTGFYGSDSLSLLGHAWKLWKNDRAVELVEPRLEISSSSSMVPLRYIHVGLLCVQESPDHRPTMSDVVAMLNSEQTTLASPKNPAFTVGRTLVNSSSSSGKGKVEAFSANELSVSFMEAR